MIIDGNSLLDGAGLQADICIVGAGGVGIAIALELAKNNIDVLLLEAGGVEPSAASQAFYRGTVTDTAMHSPLDDYRERRLGGSTTIWGGRCMPFDPIDFEARDWIPDSGWPIDADTLSSYYPRASRVCETGEFAYTVETAFDRPVKPMIAGFDGAYFSTDTLERFSCPTDFGRRYRDRLVRARTVRLVTDAAVTNVEMDAAGALVTGLAVRTANGGKVHVVAKQVVLALGGLETTRLLLASRDVHPAGIGNDHDVLGRNYMCHLAGTMGELHARPGTIWHGYDVADDGTYCRRRLALRPETQRTERVGNFIGRLHHPRIAEAGHATGVLSALYLGRSLVPQQYRKRLEDSDPDGWAGKLRHVGNVARDPVGVARFAVGMLVGRKLAERKFPSIVVTAKANTFSLDFHAEQEPNPDSRVMLGQDRDEWGMPRLKVDWRYTPGDLATVQRGLALLAEDMRRSGCGTFDYDPDAVENEMTRYGAYGGHHIGTARMGSDARHSVVDPDCRVHGTANLHVAGAAVFPTSSQANPTLTAVALALRLADRLQAIVA